MTGSPGVTRAGLDALNTIPATEAERRLSTCCASRAWVERMAAGRPCADLDVLLSASDSAVRELDAYEERFGHVFLISASGRSAEEMLAALRDRLLQP